MVVTVPEGEPIRDATIMRVDWLTDPYIGSNLTVMVQIWKRKGQMQGGALEAQGKDVFPAELLYVRRGGCALLVNCPTALMDEILNV